MNIYFIRRLIPFYAIAVILETIFTGYEIYNSPFPLDYSFEAIIKSLGITIMTTTASFLILCIPYVIYILLLPFRYQNTKLDKRITTIIFGLFCCFIFIEELSVINTNKELTSLSQMQISLTLPIISIALCGSLLLCALFQDELTTSRPAPRYKNRIFQGIMYIVISLMIFHNLGHKNISTGSNETNDRIAREDAYVLIKTTIEKLETSK